MFCKNCGNKITGYGNMCQDCQPSNYENGKKAETLLGIKGSRSIGWKDLKVLLPGTGVWVIGKLLGGGSEIVLTSIGIVAFIGGAIALTSAILKK